jgi:FAD/FMN-containing dehydrogenase
MWFRLTLLMVFLVLGASSQALSSLSECKCVPNQPCWPPDSVFEALNNTVSGRLLRSVPPAAVCYPEQPTYDAKLCTMVLSQWYNSSFHAASPTSIGAPSWADNPCPPIFPNGTSVNGDPHAGAKGCTIGRYPVFVVNATEAAHIRATIQFAKMHNIRLVIKNSGHSFQGRSTGLGSISVYTHHYRGFEIHEAFQPDNCPSTSPRVSAVTVAAGETDETMYSYLDAHGLVAVGGSNPTVGIMGWFTGGGQGPLSSTYGMGADNVLQVRVVTAAGELLTASECQNSDLFWALRGGGGSTFGVVVEAAVKTFPTPQTTVHSFSATVVGFDNATGYSLDFWRVAAYLQSEMARLRQGGMQGYYYTNQPYPLPMTYTFSWFMYLFDQPAGAAEALVAPIQQALDTWADSHPGVSITHSANTTAYPSYLPAWTAAATKEPAAWFGAALGSRLISAETFAGDQEHMARAFMNATDPSGGGGHVSSVCELVANQDNRGMDVALHPAWRDTLVSVVLLETFVDTFTPAMKTAAFERMTRERMPVLKALAPGTGGYFNEADPYDPDFGETGWGENYPRLRELKKKWDPADVFWCLGCVGSDAWMARDDGRLCRAV